MAVKVEVSGYQDDDIKYPCLMISNDGDTIVLFTDPRVGTCVSNKSKSEFATNVGMHDSTWITSLFKPFKGSITLSNE